jgi:hypothetical protein
VGKLSNGFDTTAVIYATIVYLPDSEGNSLLYIEKV